MTSKKAAGKTTLASTKSAGMRPNGGDDTTWTRDLPPAGKSAPGDVLYENLEDFVLDQSEGEESSDEAEVVAESESGNIEQSRASDGGGEGDEATEPSSARNNNDGDATDRQTSQLLAAAQPKRKRRVPYAADEEIVLYLLHTYVSLRHSTRADIFKRVFPDRAIVREKGALIMQWSRFRDEYNKKFAKLSAAEHTEHKAWKKKIDKAMKDVGVASHGDGKQGDDSDSADDQASQPATPRQPRETRARYTADHEIVLHILYGRKNLDPGIRTEIFNHVFRAEGVVRNRAAVGKHWGRFKAGIQKRFANLSPEQLAEHEAWKQEIDKAVRELYL